MSCWYSAVTLIKYKRVCVNASTVVISFCLWYFFLRSERNKCGFHASVQPFHRIIKMIFVMHIFDRWIWFFSFIGEKNNNLIKSRFSYLICMNVSIKYKRYYGNRFSFIYCYVFMKWIKYISQLLVILLFCLK